MGKSFHPMEAPALAANAPTHRLDEFPAGYYWAGWSPPEPASASPTVYEYAVIPSCRSRSFHRTVNCVLTVRVSQGGKRRYGLPTYVAHQIHLRNDAEASIT